MGNYILDNRASLSDRHYIRKANTETYWFDFSYSKLKMYQKKFGDDFCLVIFRSGTEDDAYIMPFFQVKALFDTRFLDDRNRWIGTITHNTINLSSSGHCMSVSAYYNAFQYLDSEDTNDRVGEPEEPYITDEEIGLANLEDKIRKFNDLYSSETPQKRIRISEEIARPNAISDCLKRLQNYTCQICGTHGFKQRNGTRYVETHHIDELHKQIPGSYCSDNMVVVCPTCHMKLHYADVSFYSQNESVIVTINSENFEFSRNILS